MTTISIGMRAADAATELTKLANAAHLAEENGTPFSYTVYAKDQHGGEVLLEFGNDDMERPEMVGETIVEIEVD